MAVIFIYIKPTIIHIINLFFCDFIGCSGLTTYSWIYLMGQNKKLLGNRKASRPGKNRSLDQATLNYMQGSSEGYAIECVVTPDRDLAKSSDLQFAA